MDIVIKQRDASFCNIKAILIYLVVFGHLIEPLTDKYAILMIIYKVIYFVHMPLFVFVSAYFLRNSEMCLKQAVRMLKLYIVLQILMYILSNYLKLGSITGIKIFENIRISTPFWHFWYLLSMGWWCILAYYLLKLGSKKIFTCWKTKLIIILLSVIIGCVAGLDGKIGRELSLSRTIVFLPYFLMGLYAPKNISMKKYKFVGIIALCISIVLMVCTINDIDKSFFWQADSYGEDILEGFIKRIICYIIALCLGFFVISCGLGRRHYFSKIGADTFKIYILHGFVILFITKFADTNNLVFVLASPIIAAIIIYLIYKIFMWSGQVYGIDER